jgi:hypothetical protein
VTETQDVDVGLPEILGGYDVFNYTHLLVKSWQIVTDVRDEDNGLTLCERLSQGYDHTHFDVTFKLSWWRFHKIS